MLLNFRVANHRSIREEQELQLHPAYDTDRPPGTDWAAVPVVGLFGANAAGKSNLVGALQYMASMVLNSHRDAEPGDGLTRSVFRLDAAASDEPSWYVVDLLLDGVRYTYGFSVDDERVLDEWLYSYPLGKKRKIFERPDGEVQPGDSQAKRELELVENITEPNVLFLTMAARSKQEDFRPVYDWFATGLRFAEGRTRMPLGVPTGPSRDAAALLALLRSADLGIEEYGIERQVMDEDALHRMFGGPLLQQELARLEASGPRELSRTWIGHRGRSGVVRMELHEESAGTRALLRQAPRFLSVLRQGGTFIVDEIDSSLHPLLTTQLIGLFQDPETNPRAAQLIFTSHDASLLGRADGEDILKRDQVWFVEKDRYGETRLIALSEFKPRTGENHERRYLGGSYGGVPFIDESFTKALAARGDEHGETA
ncbi:AAA family ATPase [Streptomyces sp. NBC_01022]|uniref:AAA family ATPase n=1 Tax=Streptomyces sp. NBC_01022 TaxID=2903723 RepID=UPI002DD8C160|nr:ATP-binding protein [Streptomyces sp. NBC_01022]WRZ83548.1 ATP-binding protein [Streptomyces sp. NBC_01022]